MDLGTFIEKRRPLWRQLETILQRVEGSSLAGLDDAQAVEFGRLYRSAASDLNQAQTFISGDTIVQYLNDLVARCYLVIYGKTKTDWWRLVRHFLWEYPVVFRRYLGHFLLAAVITAGGAVFGYLAFVYDSEAARSFLSPGMNTIQPREEGEEDQRRTMTTGQFSQFSGRLFYNNASVTLFAFALGITLGIGTTWLLWYNGILLGGVLAIFVEKGQLLAFCTEILPHGVLELPAIFLGGAAGLLLAQGMIRSRPWPRREELARSAKEALRLVSGAIPMLMLAAVLEAGVARAPDWFFGSGFKLGVAGLFGLLFAAYVFLVGWSWRNTEGDSKEETL